MGFDTGELQVLKVDLEDSGVTAEEKAGAAVEKTAADIEADGKVFAPVDTGHLVGSISSDVDGLSAEVGPTAEYGAYVEDGTSRAAPQPYMGPAADRRFPQFEDAIAQIGEDIL